MQFALGSLYEDNGEFDKARTHYSNVLRSDPKNLDALLAMGRVEIKAGNPEHGLDPLNRALTVAIQSGQSGTKGSDPAGDRDRFPDNE